MITLIGINNNRSKRYQSVCQFKVFRWGTMFTCSMVLWCVGQLQRIWQPLSCI